jgi:hypothetical protein
MVKFSKKKHSNLVNENWGFSGFLMVDDGAS